jgi:16S rRNA G1207 methylase RsmC
MNENYCLVCGNKDLKYYGEKGVIRLLICLKCDFGFADRNYWKDPYENLDYYEKNPVEVSYPLKFSKTDVDRLNVLKKWLSEEKELKILDFGSGYGTTAIALKKVI